MAQWTVHRNPNPATRKEVPYLLDAQADLLSALGTRTVIPLFARKAAPSQTLSRLTPELKLGNERLVLMTPQLAGVRLKDLGTAVGDFTAHRAEIIAALDLLLTGV
ncbi:MAG: CcdB family protein [Acidobacteria bacterium]|nr:CcdB family protein [Acidobacteriota bacterium]